MSEPTTPDPSAPPPVEACWRVVIPVKDTRHGKSRLARATGADRSALSRSIADDTIAAAASAVGVGHVVLVTSDAALARQNRRRGIDVVADPGTGLNPAIEVGLLRVRSIDRRSRPAVLLGDLPCLRPGDLHRALQESGLHDQTFVPDSDGTGTVLRCGSAASGFVPRFGRSSAARHAADGAVRLELDLPRLRTDVDDPASLAAAVRLGLGPRTLQIVGLRGSGWIHPMQASVHTFDPQNRSGSVLLDDGLQTAFTSAVFDASGLRLLRVGQRLTVEVADGVIVSLGIVGIGPGQPIR